MKCFSKVNLTLIQVILFSSLNVFGDVVGESHASIEDELPAQSELRTATWFSASSFENSSSRVIGSTYLVGVGLTSPWEWKISAELPFHSGFRAGYAAQESGNPKFSAEFSTLDLRYMQLWTEVSAKLSRPGAKFASRHDTYRGGLSFRNQLRQFSFSAGAGYRARVNEEDPKVDAGDLQDAHFRMGIGFMRQWTVELEYLWYRSEGLKKDGQVFSRNVEWAGVSPGLRYRVGSALAVKAAVVLPVTMTRTPEETEISLWEAGSLAQTSPALLTEVGVAF